VTGDEERKDGLLIGEEASICFPKSCILGDC